MIHSTLFLLKIEWKYARKLFIWLFFGMIYQQLFTFAPLYLISLIINRITNFQADGILIDKALLIYVICLVGLKILDSLFSSMTQAAESNNLFVYDENFKRMLYEKALNLNPQYYEDSKVYDLYSQVTNYRINDIHNAIKQIFSFFAQIISIIISFNIIFSTNAILAVVFILLYIPVLIASIKGTTKTYKFFYDNNVNERKKSLLFEFVHDKKAIQELKVYNAFDFIVNTRTAIAEKFHDESFKLQLKNLNTRTFFNLLPEILYYIAYFFYAIEVLTSKIALADFTFVTGNISVLRSNLQLIISFITHHVGIIKSLNLLETFLNLEDERGDNNSFDNSVNKLKLTDISFKYPNSENTVLNNINLQINKGDKLAVVGYNGSGKTTLSKLLIGLFDDYDGEYTINDRNVKDINHKDIYKIFSTATQDYVKYPFTIKENIIIGSMKENSEDYQNAVDIGDVNDIINNSEFKENTYLNKEYDENGIDLSEGQWHKIILTRTIYQNHEVIVFDEPTSSLDPIAEYEFVKNILDKLSDKTIILISHRLSSVINFDKIIVLNDGTITEAGNHTELMALNGLYAEMYLTQAQRYN